MTILATFSVRASSEEDANLRPLQWRRMAWVTWRQHRTALIGVAALLGAVALCFWFAGLRLHHAYAVAIACHPASSFACGDLVNSFNGMYSFLANGLLPQAIPVVVGAFVGAPVLAREMETRTYRFAWTQGFGRWRWTLAKLVALAVLVTAATGALSVLFSWYFQPYFAAGNQSLNLSALNPFTAPLFDLRGVSFAGWTLAAFAIGGLAGVLIRRVVPTIAATLAVYVGLAFLVGGFLRQHYLTPLVTRSLNVPGSAWVLSQQWFTKGGQPVSQSELGQVLQRGAPPRFAGKGGVPESLGAWQYLVQHGFRQLTTYQQASRFWPFQWIEGGWLFALSVVLLAATVSLVRRRAT